MWDWPCNVTKCKVKQNNKMSERRIWLQNESLAERTRIEQWRNVLRSWEPRICTSFLFAFFWNSHTLTLVENIRCENINLSASSTAFFFFFISHISAVSAEWRSVLQKRSSLYFLPFVAYERKFVWCLKSWPSCHALRLICLLTSRTGFCPKKGIIIVK